VRVSHVRDAAGPHRLIDTGKPCGLAAVALGANARRDHGRSGLPGCTSRRPDVYPCTPALPSSPGLAARRETLNHAASRTRSGLRPRRRQPHRAASPATSQSPQPSSASPSDGCSSVPPGSRDQLLSTRTTPSSALTATVTVSPGASEPPCRTLLPNSSPSSAASSPHGCLGPSTAPTDVRAIRARSARPATVTLSWIPGPAISAPVFPGRPAPRQVTGAAEPDVRMHARLSGSRQAGTRDRHGPSVPSVEADGGHRPS
jgi:hypothetical protein